MKAAHALPSDQHARHPRSELFQPVIGLIQGNGRTAPPGI